jgi:hypothetical protein
MCVVLARQFYPIPAIAQQLADQLAILALLVALAAQMLAPLVQPLVQMGPEPGVFAAVRLAASLAMMAKTAEQALARHQVVVVLGWQVQQWLGLVVLVVLVVPWV